MCLLTRLLVLTLLFENNYAKLAGELRRTKDMQHGRYFLNLLGFIHGFKVGQEYALQIAPVLYTSPVIVIPSINQQQSVSIQKATTDESYQEMGGTTQIITSAKLIDNSDGTEHRTTAPHSEEIDENFEIHDRNDLRITNVTDVSSDIIREDIVLNEDLPNASTVSVESKLPTSPVNRETTTIRNKVAKTTKLPPILNSTGFYPAANYSNKEIGNLTLTTIAPNTTQVILTNTTDFDVNTTIAISNIEATKTNQTTTNSFGPYPSATYDNKWVSKFAITTEFPSKSEEHYLPPSEDKRWNKFSITMEGFKPLAGLYYDGFLHVPLLKKSGWTPYNNYI